MSATSPPAPAGAHRILLVPDLPIERWHSMDRYAAALAQRLPVELPRALRTIQGPRYLARYVRYPRALRAEPRPALVHVVDHSYAHCLAAFPRVPSLLSVHDLYPVHLLRKSTGGLRTVVRDRLLNRTMRWVARADLLVAATRFVAAEAEDILGLEAGAVRIAPNGVDDVFFVAPHPAVAAERRSGWLAGLRAGDDARVVLHVGLCVPRKRVEIVIAATAELRRRGANAILVQIGGRFSREQERMIGAAGLESFVVQESRVSEPALVAAYHAADVLLLPSSYEGFGLPVLEALAAGLPVVTSGEGGLREAGGDAAINVDGDAPLDYAAAVLGVWHTGPEADARRERGLAHARAHSWDETARKIRLVYAELGAPT